MSHPALKPTAKLTQIRNPKGQNPLRTPFALFRLSHQLGKTIGDPVYMRDLTDDRYVESAPGDSPQAAHGIVSNLPALTGTRWSQPQSPVVEQIVISLPR